MGDGQDGGWGEYGGGVVRMGGVGGIRGEGDGTGECWVSVELRCSGVSHSDVGPNLTVPTTL